MQIYKIPDSKNKQKLGSTIDDPNISLWRIIARLCHLFIILSAWGWSLDAMRYREHS